MKQKINQLLDGYYYPVTQQIGFLKAPLKKVAEEYWHLKCHDPYTKNPQEYFLAPKFVTCSLREGLEMLDPIGYPQTLFCETRTDWTAVFVPGGFMSLCNLANSLNCRGVEITLIEDTYNRKTNQGTHGCVRLHVIRDGNRPRFMEYTERLIYVMKSDGGHRWEFHSSGTIMPFEEVENYNKQKITDRFTPQMLDKYLNALGIQMLEEHFYGPTMAHADYKNRFSDSCHEKQTYMAYHMDHMLPYGRVLVRDF